MLFNSLDFAVFLPLVFAFYWFVFKKNLKYQNAFIVVASYVFYGWWDWRFLGLIIFSTLLDFYIGKSLKNEERTKRRKSLLHLSLFVNLGFLGVFKYYNFFIENFAVAFSFFGKNIQTNSLDIILPVGISFYTFQTLSYTIDVYRKKLEPANDPVAFAAFVCFFPQLVAGPIERATNLLPQFYIRRSFDYDKAKDGARQILWGLFKKVVIADNCATYANLIFNNHEDYNGSTLVLGSIFFTFQIYGDFSGYSDIAIGVSRLFGFTLKQNFATPYFARDIAEFWRRWHMSLSTWFRDYLYIPLGGSRGGSLQKIRNTFVIFIVSGFWHGANWTYIVWGGLNALYFLPLQLLKINRVHLDAPGQGRMLPTFRETSQILTTFVLTVTAWIFFRSDSITTAFAIFAKIFSSSLLEIPRFLGIRDAITTSILVALMMIFDWVGRNENHSLKRMPDSLFFRTAVYLFFLHLILSNAIKVDEVEFIYFQF